MVEILLGAIAAMGAVTTGLFLLLVKNISQRVQSLEETYYTKTEIRQIIADKVGGIHEDLQEIKIKIDKLFDLYIENKLKK